MKKYIILALSMLTVLGCAQFEELKGVSEVKPLTTGITVTTNTVDASVPRPDSYTVRFINYDEKLDISAKTDATGKVSVPNLIPGRYNVTVSAEVAQGGFTYYYSGTLTNKVITSDTSLSIDAAASKAGALVFKEIYYNGASGYYFKDQFYEIYNNSDEVQYVDGLCIGTLMPATASTTIYNWIVEDGHPENYVYLGAVWQIPGSGSDYPVKPGESIIIAQGAQNHKLIKDTSPVDLSKAEFETFIVNQTVNPDNPESVNMTLKIDFNVFGTQWLSSVFGCAYVIFFPDREFDNSTWVQPDGYTTKAKEFPIDCIIDGVELVNNATKINQKRMPTTIDAGATFTGATYTGKSVCRKIRSTKDGRNLYMDTNNSSDDFQVTDVAVVRRDGAGVPSWSPAAK
ncbi:MAG: DUF4876 domain-containing protein [Bacteroidales bacterium]|nr:DUF4876 domain-containing protein [Bacteroidales bacterium]MBQ2599646.1 DUF4876 domain-containing protein [Bacteroidales bacterium]